jgi:hypothetical protein
LRGPRPPSRLAPGRLLLGAAAALAAAWLALGFRSAVLEERGGEAVDRATFGGLPAGEVDRARSWLQRARRFSADAGPLIIEGRLLFFSGRTGQAADIGERVVALEPENFDGWALLYVASRGRDPERAAEAFRAIRELNPPAAEAFR